MFTRNSFISLLTCFAVGLILWFIPHASHISDQGWRLFVVFACTILGIILKPLPMGAVAFIALTVATATETLSVQDALSGFSNDIVWLVVCVFFIAKGFILSGFDKRVAYRIFSFLGSHSLGLGYGLVVTDLIIAPLVPSQTARGGGILYPLLTSLSKIFTGTCYDPKVNAFLTLTAFHGNAITSAMFLTAMAGNPLIVELASSVGVHITWTSWMMAALLPGVISLLLIPYIIYRFISPTIRNTPDAKKMAIEHLRNMGPMKIQEWIVLGTFCFLIICWVFGHLLGIKPVITAMVGLAVFLVTNVVQWKDITEEKGAWDTFVWFAVLITLPKFLNQYGFTMLLSEWIAGYISGFEWIIGFAVLGFIYFYAHYLFASNVGQISAMYVPFLVTLVVIGTPPLMAALSLAFLSSLFGSLTHYGSGPAPILFSTGFASLEQWWKVGALNGLIYLVVWLGIGSAWWKVLGLW